MGSEIHAGDLTDAQGVVIGTGSVAANVTVHVQRAIEDGLPPELQNATLREMQLGTIAAVQHLEERWYYAQKADLEERRLRQAESDTHRRKIVRWLIILTSLGVLYGATTLIWVWQWISRFGWFW